MCGHGAIKEVDATGCEPVGFPAELWLCSSVGFSFPNAEEAVNTWLNAG